MKHLQCNGWTYAFTGPMDYMEIKFYNVPTGMIQFGDSLYCRLCLVVILGLHEMWIVAS